MFPDILSLRRGQCKFCVTDDTPFLFCGEPVREDSSYCAPHHTICHNGFGRDIAALETMMRGQEHSISYKGKEVRGETSNHGGPANTIPVDVQIRGPE